MKLQILNGTVLTPEGRIEGGSVIVEGHKIISILNNSEPVEGAKVIDAQGGYIMPGGIDIHVHGGGGRDFMECAEDAFVEAVAAHRRHGTTAILPTLSSSTIPMICEAAETAQKLMDDPYSGVLGVHLEGPYFNPKMAGGQMPENIKLARPEEYVPIIEKYRSIRRWDAAPEMDGSCELATYLRSKGVMASLGHTAADYKDVERGYKAGFTHATHFYNAMTGNHKEGVFKHEGTVESVYLIDGITVEMIADGIHVPPTMLRLIWKQKGVERTCLITDALACAASDSKTAFDPRVIIEDGVCKLADRSAIAGSIATMDRLFRVAVQQAGIPLDDVSRMASETPARLLGVYDRKGSLSVGKDADIIVMTPELELTHVVQMGREVEL